MEVYVTVLAKTIYMPGSNPETGLSKLTLVFLQIMSTHYLKDLKLTLQGSELLLFMDTYLKERLVQVTSVLTLFIVF